MSPDPDSAGCGEAEAIPDDARRRRSGGRKRATEAVTAPARLPDYRHLRHPFTPQTVFSDAAIADIHETALKVLQELGLRVLLPEAREIFVAAGARCVDDMVFLGRDIVEAALAVAPRRFALCAANPARAQVYETGTLLFGPGAGCPNVSDRLRGRRPGNLDAYIETLKLQQSFDVIHIHGPSAEPQDVAAPYRHYAMTRGQMEWGDKPMFVYGRGRRQVNQCFEMIRLGLGLSDAAFAGGVWANTVINSNSPRMLDAPMAEALIDFARAGQLSIVTPFCLAGAMAPITVAGALTLQHAEALACITLAQLARAGAPVSYGGFSSNVDMRSGAPAFGTPEHVKMQIGSGQLARHIGLPWRSAAGAASNMADAQGATENVTALWGGLMANATLMIHSAGWLEGGLTFGYEKFVNDVEALQTIAELCVRPAAGADEIGFDALAEVAPGGHFFGTTQTKARYDTEFYAPLVADLSNHGAWSEAGARSAEQRATDVWQARLADYRQPATGPEAADRLVAYIEAGIKDGGAPPVE